jgi:hypothetical protein
LYLNYRGPYVEPTYIGERRTTFAKAYGIKVRCYGEMSGKTLGTWGTYLKLDKNPLGAQREHIGKKIKIKPPSPSKGGRFYRKFWTKQLIAYF